MGADGYMSCASCHLDGGSDHRVWDFTQQGEGLRRTIALNGRAGMGHGFVHWSANFDEIQDFEIQIRNLFAGTGFIADPLYHPDPLSEPLAGRSSDLDHLAAYAASLESFGRSPHRNSDGSLTAEGEAGRLLFEAAGCHTCHEGSTFSDSGRALMHDVGTLAEHSGQRLGSSALTGLDTPTLRGLWLGGPYLHDGSATDLHEVLVDTNDNNAHGSISGLSQQDIDHLVAYLLQLDDDAAPAASSPLVLEWLGPAHGISHASGATVNLAAAVDLPDLQRLEFLADGDIIATLTEAPWQAPYSGDDGSVWLQARAIYGDNRTSLTRPVHVGFGLCDPGDIGPCLADELFHDRFGL
jgi:large repetitive protein